MTPYIIMLTRRIVQTSVVSKCTKKLIHSITPPPHNNGNDHDYMTKVVMGAACTGGTIGAGYGSYNGYLLNRHKSYTNCAIETTLSCFIGAAVGIGGGVTLCYISPIVFPLICLGMPVAGGAVMVKYFDENFKNM
jgi:hypothetical protein